MSSSTSTTVDAGSDAENLSWVVLLVVLLVLSLTSVIVGMRIYTRIFLVKQLGWDDYCVVVTLVRLRFSLGEREREGEGPRTPILLLREATLQTEKLTLCAPVLSS